MSLIDLNDWARRKIGGLPGVAPPSQTNDNAYMNTPTREEFEARMAAAEARADARFIAFEKTIADAVGSLRLDISEVAGEIKAANVEMAHLKNFKANIWGSAATVIGALLALASIAVAMFESGRNTAALVSTSPAVVAPAVQTPQPIIIQIPQSAPTPAPVAPKE